MMPNLERALWVAYGRALEADCFETARDLMDAIMALQQRRILLEPNAPLAHRQIMPQSQL